jgi:hypothetical protein
MKKLTEFINRLMIDMLSLAHWKAWMFPMRRMMAILLVFGMLTACSRAGSQATPTPGEPGPLPFGDKIQKVLDDGLKASNTTIGPLLEVVDRNLGGNRISGLDNLEIPFVVSAFLFQSILIFHFALRKWRFDLAMIYGRFVYALSIIAVLFIVSTILNVTSHKKSRSNRLKTCCS